MTFNRVLVLGLSWSLLWVGCAPLTSTDLRTASEQSKIKAAKKRGDTDLHIAAVKGNSTAVLALIGQGADVNAVNDNGHTPLVFAIQQEQAAIAKLLVAHGAKVDVTDEKGETPLHHSIRAGQSDVVGVLLEKGGSPSRANKAKDTPLTLATQLDYPDIALMLIARGAQVAVIDGQGLAPLHYAANWRRTAVVHELLVKGVDPNVKAPKDQTALMTSAYFGDLPTVMLLLDKGARVDARDGQGQTSLHLAALNGHRDVVSTLLGQGADVNASTKAGRTPALIAAQNDRADLLKDLARAGARFVPLSETESDRYASALVAQAIAEAALKQKDLARTREHHKLAVEWFGKAATAYEDAANSADNKILAKKILIGVGVVMLVTAAVVLAVMAQQSQANYQHKQMAEILALQNASAGGTGMQGYFSNVIQYEKAFQASTLASNPALYAGANNNMVASAFSYQDPDLTVLRDLYYKVAEQGRQAVKYNSTRLNCLGPSSTETERAACLNDISFSFIK